MSSIGKSLTKKTLPDKISYHFAGEVWFKTCGHGDDEGFIIMRGKEYESKVLWGWVHQIKTKRARVNLIECVLVHKSTPSIFFNIILEPEYTKGQLLKYL